MDARGKEANIADKFKHVVFVANKMRDAITGFYTSKILTFPSDHILQRSYVMNVSQKIIVNGYRCLYNKICFAYVSQNYYQLT